MSRHWRERLSSDDLTRAAISRWQTHDPSDSARPWDLEDATNTRKHVRHMQAQICKKPYSRLVFNDTGTVQDSPHRNIWQRRLDLKSRRIAYISSRRGQGDAVAVHDLITGASWALRGEARERIMYVVLTSTLVAFITYDGCLYYSIFAGATSLEEARRIRLPSSLVRACGAHRDRIVVAMGGELDNRPYVSEVLFFNATDMRLSSLEVKSIFALLEGDSERLYACGVIVDRDRETVDVFTLAYTETTRSGTTTKNLQMLHVRISTKGNKAHLEYSARQGICTGLNRHLLFTIAHPAPTGVQGQYRIEVCQSAFINELPLRHTVDVLFDIEQARMLPIPEPKGPPPHESYMARTPNRALEDLITPSAVWKGRTYRPASTEFEWCEYAYLMNDTFLMSLEVNKEFQARSRIRVFCYDERVSMAGGRSTGLWEE